MFSVDDRVNRIEDRETTAATVLAVETADEEPIYLIAYDEGGQGWWPESALTAET